jgi:hypothetical protein
MIKWLKGLFFERQPPKPKTLIWGVVDGPYLREDFPEEELYHAGIPEDSEAMLVCKVEESGEVFVVNFWYDTMNEAYEVKKYFDTNMEPLEVKL